MTLSVVWKILDAAKVDIGAEIADDGPAYVNPFKRLVQNCAALYEYIWDATAPGGSGQTYKGHDHGLIGPPITRSAVFSMDWGNSALINFQPSGSNWFQWRTIGADNAYRFDRPFVYDVSPRLPQPTQLEGWIHYGANIEFQLRAVEENTAETLAQGQNEYSLPAMGAGESSRWLHLPYIPAQPGQLNKLQLYSRAKGYDANNPPFLTLYGLIIAETPATTLPPDGGVAL